MPTQDIVEDLASKSVTVSGPVPENQRRPGDPCPGRHCFPSCLRLHLGRDYARVFAKPRRSTDRTVTVLGRPNGLDVPRLGLAISKRWLRRAVDRNRVKRLIRESFRMHREQLLGWDVVVISRSATAEIGTGIQTADFSRSLARHWRRIANPAGKKTDHP